MRLSNKLRELGFTIQRLKTGTPPRIEKASINFELTKLEEGDRKLYTFSYDNSPKYKIKDQLPCHLIYTKEETHEIIRSNLEKSSMYGGFVEGIGPRYCPSIEDKVVRFSDKERHQLFLEPESLYYDNIYLQGFSTSMPHDIQEKMVHSLPGLEKAIIKKYAYAIEYDAIDPTQLKPSLETKIIKNLFTAGQINGTSGYEEAAGQGLIAGINASLKLNKRKPLVLKRNEAYIGVLIDDLVTKGTKEPYRLLTSRAEYRLLLRNDNADLRLREYGKKVGLIDDKKYRKFVNYQKEIKDLIKYLKSKKLTTKDNHLLEKLNTNKLKDGITLYNFIKRPEISIKDLIKLKKINIPINKRVLEEVELLIKYEGYIKKAEKEAKNLIKQESIIIPSDIDYNKISNLASEALQKFNNIRPETLAQAARISGVNPSDIAILSVYLKRKKHE
jgi:tRNA uridine 5-carboxymethylaminomethyl modification enzyme